MFHPNGNEVSIDEGVWDLRTHRLLRTLPCQDGAVMKPSPDGEVLYTYRCVCVCVCPTRSFEILVDSFI